MEYIKLLGNLFPPDNEWKYTATNNKIYSQHRHNNSIKIRVCVGIHWSIYVKISQGSSGIIYMYSTVGNVFFLFCFLITTPCWFWIVFYFLSCVCFLCIAEVWKSFPTFVDKDLGWGLWCILFIVCSTDIIFFQISFFLNQCASLCWSMSRVFGICWN